MSFLRVLNKDSGNVEGDNKTVDYDSYSVPKDCKLCTLGQGNAVTPTGPDKLSAVKLIVIGDRPGVMEAKTGNHFVGGLSKVARFLIKKFMELDTQLPDTYGYLDSDDSEQVLYLNAVLCHTKTEVKKEHYVACSTHINAILEKTGCPVLLCGGQAIEYHFPLPLVGKAKKWTVRDARGKSYFYNNRYWVCTFNPAIVQRGTAYHTGSNKKPNIIFDSMLWHFIRDLLMVKECINLTT